MSSAVPSSVPAGPAAPAGRSRARALALALLGLVGMFFTLLGWTGQVRDLGSTWGAAPLTWVVIGGLVTLGAAIADAVLGANADFVTGPGAQRGGARFLNRVLPWLIVVLTLVGMLVVSLVHG